MGSNWGEVEQSASLPPSDLNNIIRSQRLFFNDFNFPYYAISLIEGDNPGSMGGTKLQNSFTAFLPKGMNPIDYYILFAHENLHNWIGSKIRNDKGEELNYWWTEGFTEFYTRLITLRSGEIPPNIFIKEFNQFLLNYYLSPVVREPNARIKSDFWNNQDVQQLPYSRGFVFAVYLNNKIQRNNLSHSLDDIILDLFKNAAKQDFSMKVLEDGVQKYITGGIHQDISNFIDQGDIIPLDNINLPLIKTMSGRYYLGFNREAALNDSVIKDIDNKSNAYMAGLRNGQKILEFDVPKGRGIPDQVITIRTAEGTVQFRPEHSDKIEVYQLKEALSKPEQQQFNKFFGSRS